jgi:hypothetical protein
VLAKQRVIANEAGPLYAELRDRIERVTIETAKWKGDLDDADPDLKAILTGKDGPPLLQQPGVYLRLSLQNADTPEKIRKASRDSLRDAFTACFLHVPHMDAHQGKPCKKSKECDKGEICNEVELCSKPGQPYNMRVAYRGMRVLEEDWVRDVETASHQLRLRAFEADVDDATANDVPVALDLLKRARYFLLVLDEIPPGTTPEDGGTLEQAVQSDVHPARVVLYDLRDKKLLFRAKRTIDVNLPVVPGNIEAQRRQILNCALAQEIRDTMGVPP